MRLPKKDGDSVYLKSLTLSGFKSFGKTIVFEFRSSVTAIVGPNGSGKSNVAESIRWVLGEQSMKSLRGKRGEDLIFNGSEHVPRLGRAEVKLSFDNSKKQFPFEFDEVIVSRRVIRDGTNEYLLNGTAVRLKDIFELLSKVGLGSTQHHIISQGEVDRILWASPIERQEMIEEALGLKEFHMKRREAERKLAETDANMKEVEAGRREIQPHLKYLKDQSAKMRAHEDFRRDLDKKLFEYAEREGATLAIIVKEGDKLREPLMTKRSELEKKIANVETSIKIAEKEFTSGMGDDQLRKRLTELGERERDLTRELGRIEGQLAAAMVSVIQDVPLAAVLPRIQEVADSIDALVLEKDFTIIKARLNDLQKKLKNILSDAVGNKGSSLEEELKSRKAHVANELQSLGIALREVEAQSREHDTARDHRMRELRDRERELRDLERELESVKEGLREIDFSEERSVIRRNDWELFLKDNKIDRESLGESRVFNEDGEREALLRAVERLRIKLEEAGGIDSSVVKEYEETLARDEFLNKELEDLHSAKKSLEGLLVELDKTLKRQFAEGLKKINDEFAILFRRVFGGGRAALTYTESRNVVDESGEMLEEKGGVDITLDIPRKRLRSLDMLSGGERALTSVALLFAMSSVNPPPFLVLDETDAALDEANSQRYGDLLEELATKTQLIVITHNRYTMSRAGVLYGVTMGNDGISRTLSLKFEEAKELAGVE